MTNYNQFGGSFQARQAATLDTQNEDASLRPALSFPQPTGQPLPPPVQSRAPASVKDPSTMSLDVVNIRQALGQGQTLNPLEANLYIGDLFLKAGLAELQVAGKMNAEAAVYLRQAQQANSTTLPYTHEKLAVREGDDGSDATVNMLDEIVVRRREKQQQLARQYETAEDIISG